MFKTHSGWHVSVIPHTLIIARADGTPSVTLSRRIRLTDLLLGLLKVSFQKFRQLGVNSFSLCDLPRVR